MLDVQWVWFAFWVWLSRKKANEGDGRVTRGCHHREQHVFLRSGVGCRPVTTMEDS